MSIDTVDRVQMDVNDGRPNSQPAPAPAPVPAPATPPVAPSGDPTFRLSRPLTLHSGQQITELVLKMPTLRSFVKYGSFFTLVRVEKSEPGDSRVASGAEVFERFDFKALLGFVADMTGYDDIVLDRIAANDAMPLAYAVLTRIGTRDPR